MPRPAAGIERRFVLHIKVDNFFDHELSQLHRFASGSTRRFNKGFPLERPDRKEDWEASDKYFEAEYRITFDPRSFDTQHWFQVVAKYFQGWETVPDLKKITDAFQEELHRHEQANMRKRKATYAASRSKKQRTS